MRKYEVFYDVDYDRLMVAGKTARDVMVGSVRVLNVVLDFNTKKQVVNAELLHASEYVESLGMDSSILERFDGGRLMLRQLRNGYEIVFVLSIGKREVAVPYNVHLPERNQISITSS